MVYPRVWSVTSAMFQQTLVASQLAAAVTVDAARGTASDTNSTTPTIPVKSPGAVSDAKLVRGRVRYFLEGHGGQYSSNRVVLRGF